jgi:glutathione S-transferase
MAHLTLYDFPPVPSPQKVRVAMAEKGISCDRVIIDLKAGEQRSAKYLQINPHGLVPTLMVDGTPIYESTAIIEYLEETYPHPALLPRGALSRAKARMIEESIDGNFATALKTYGRNLKALPPAVPDLKLMEECRQSVAWHNHWLNGALEGRRFMAGDEFSIADIAAICNVEFQIKRLKLDIDIKNLNLLAWYERTISRPSMHALKK